MHMQGEPRTMQADPRYGDVVAEVRDFLVERARSCEAAGIARDRIVIDPGFGFGKTVAHNLALLRSLDVLTATGYPVLVGMSRKSTLGSITGRDVERSRGRERRGGAGRGGARRGHRQGARRARDGRRIESVAGHSTGLNRR